MGRRSGLGKGLEALIPPQDEVPIDALPTSGSLQRLPIDLVRPNRNQPRGGFDEAALEELATSIKAVGVLQPVLVRSFVDESGTEAFELIAGERRLRAARRAGLTHLPALVRDVASQQSLEEALVENLQREDLNVIEEAAAFRQLIDEFDLSHDEVAGRVGKSRSAVTNTLRLLQLPTEVVDLVASRRLSAGHARALLAVEAPELQLLLARQASDGKWSVRRVEEEVRQRVQSSDETQSVPSPKRPVERPAALLELEELLSSHLDTRVSVQIRGRRGRLTIDFGGIEDLERIYRAMVEGRESD